MIFDRLFVSLQYVYCVSPFPQLSPAYSAVCLPGVSVPAVVVELSSDSDTGGASAQRQHCVDRTAPNADFEHAESSDEDYDIEADLRRQRSSLMANVSCINICSACRHFRA